MDWLKDELFLCMGDNLLQYKCYYILVNTYIYIDIIISFKNNLSLRKMDKNYYQILSVKKNSTPQQITQTYRKQVLRWHPKFAKQDHNTAQHHFSQISQAYQVLSDPVLRSFYDRYGYTRLKEGSFSEGELKGGYRFRNNAEEIFQKFFQGNNLFAQLLDQKVIQKGSIFSHAFGALNYKDTYPNHDLVVQVPCTLSELYRGVAKVTNYQRKVLNLDGRTLSQMPQQKLLQIKAGSNPQTQLVFPNSGNQTISRNKSNLIFKIRQIPHPNYQRQGDNLIYTAKIKLSDALACNPIQIRTLDDRVLRVSLDQIPNPQVLKEVAGEGMPIFGGRGRGNLYVKFDVEFPKVVSEAVKKELRELLK